MLWKGAEMGGYSHKKKHLIFEYIGRRVGKKTDNWMITNGEGQHLGRVVYLPGWRKYVTELTLEAKISFDAKCHIQAAEFLNEQTAKLKATWKKRKEVS